VSFLRPIFYVLILLGLALTSVSPSAQTAAPETQEQVQTETSTATETLPEENAPAPSAAIPADTAPKIDLNDPAIQEAINAKEAADARLRVARDYLYRSRGFLRAVWQVALLALFAVILKSTLGQDWLVKIAQGLAVVFLLYSVIKTFITNEMLQKLAIWILIPLALLIVFGFYDDLTAWLNSLKLGQGEDAISAMTIVLLGIFGTIFFKLATYSNSRGQDAIRAQESLDSTTRERPSLKTLMKTGPTKIRVSVMKSISWWSSIQILTH